jgi:osmotically inducible protein OsmC
MSHLYTARAIAVGGRSGTLRAADALLDLQLAMPKELGGKGGATNSEQLFAAGYAAYFGNTAIHFTRTHATKVHDNEVEVVGEVGLVANDAGSLGLAVTPEIAITGLDRAKAEEIVQTVHAVCLYSNATKGSVDVILNVTTR